jgi:hypothetical protein
VCAGTAVAAFIGLNGMEYHPATPNTVAVASGSIRLADSNDDQTNELEQQLSQKTAQQTEDTSQEDEQRAAKRIRRVNDGREQLNAGRRAGACVNGRCQVPVPA